MHTKQRTLSLSIPKALRYAAIPVLASTALLSTAPTSFASSHSDAPLIKQDPQVNLTDVYAFIRTRPGGERVLVVEANVRPFSEPGDGVMYETFSSDAIYSIHITHPVTGKETRRYDFQFSPVDVESGGDYKNVDTILRYGRGTEIGPIQTVGDARQNYTQSYTVTRPERRRFGRTKRFKLAGDGPLLVAPPNVGMKTTPAYNDENGEAISGATSRGALDTYTAQTTYDIAENLTVFCGPREDGFYADTPGIFDLLQTRILDNNGSLADGLGQDGDGVDGFKGFNVMHYGIVIPLTDLESYPYTGALQPEGNGVGVYASVSRPKVTIRSKKRPDRSSRKFIQVNRLGNPLFNEVLVALGDKDKYNRSSPEDDAKLFAKYAENPEVAVLINAVFGTEFQTTDRADLKAIFIPDVIRVNTDTGATNIPGDDAFNRLSFIGGDVIDNGNGAMIPAGWPNGRRFGDDVVDIALTAVASGPTFETITVVGDNAATNDQTYNRTFPYAATPHAGPKNRKDSGPNDDVETGL